MKSADKFNSFSIYGVFLITLTNFLISAFSGGPNSQDVSMEQSKAPPDVLEMINEV